MSLPAARTTITTIQDINNRILPHSCPDRYLTSVLSSSSIMDLVHTFTPSTHSSPVLPSHLCSHCVYCFLYFSRQSPVLFCFLSSMCSHPNSPSIPITSLFRTCFCTTGLALSISPSIGTHARRWFPVQVVAFVLSVYPFILHLLLNRSNIHGFMHVRPPFLLPYSHPFLALQVSNQPSLPSIHLLLQKPLANAFACTNHSFMRVDAHPYWSRFLFTLLLTEEEVYSVYTPHQHQ